MANFWKCPNFLASDFRYKFDADVFSHLWVVQNWQFSLSNLVPLSEDIVNSSGHLNHSKNFKAIFLNWKFHSGVYSKGSKASHFFYIEYLNKLRDYYKEAKEAKEYRDARREKYARFYKVAPYNAVENGDDDSSEGNIKALVANKSNSQVP